MLSLTKGQGSLFFRPQILCLISWGADNIKYSAQENLKVILLWQYHKRYTVLLTFVLKNKQGCLIHSKTMCVAAIQKEIPLS
jgi:hypothetical protein